MRLVITHSVRSACSIKHVTVMYVVCVYNSNGNLQN